MPIEEERNLQPTWNTIYFPQLILQKTRFKTCGLKKSYRGWTKPATNMKHHLFFRSRIYHFYRENTMAQCWRVGVGWRVHWVSILTRRWEELYKQNTIPSCGTDWSTQLLQSFVRTTNTIKLPRHYIGNRQFFKHFGRHAWTLYKQFFPATKTEALRMFSRQGFPKKCYKDRWV